MSQYYLHSFSDLEHCSFSIEEYSRLKFGSNKVARKFGQELAIDFFKDHAEKLLAQRVVVIPSPYNHVENAATLLTKAFVDELNHLLINANGEHVEYSIIHRKVSYISDYGFLTADQRKDLIDGDSFYLNKDFYQDKFLLFLDDVNITGTHENKLIEILEKEGVQNNRMFVYYAKYFGKDASIESKINFAGLKTYADYIWLSEEKDHQIIVRPLKFLLGLPEDELKEVLNSIAEYKVRKIYVGCLGEGYYKIPKYQNNFKIIQNNRS